MLALGVSSSRAGDIFLSHLAEEMHMGISYRNHSGAISCFILRSIELDNPVFEIKDANIAIGSQKALMRPDFSKLLSEKVIVLECFIKNATFLELKEKIKKGQEVFPFLGGDSSFFTDKLIDTLFKTINTTLFVYKDSVRFTEFEATSENIRVKASGFISENGNFNIDLTMFFSPLVALHFPEEVKALLTEEEDGWMSYHLYAEGGEDQSFFKLESDAFKINFEKVETK